MRDETKSEEAGAALLYALVASSCVFFLRLTIFAFGRFFFGILCGVPLGAVLSFIALKKPYPIDLSSLHQTNSSSLICRTVLKTILIHSPRQLHSLVRFVVPLNDDSHPPRPSFVIKSDDVDLRSEHRKFPSPPASSRRPPIRNIQSTPDPFPSLQLSPRATNPHTNASTSRVESVSPRSKASSGLMKWGHTIRRITPPHTSVSRKAKKERDHAEKDRRKKGTVHLTIDEFSTASSSFSGLPPSTVTTNFPPISSLKTARGRLQHPQFHKLKGSTGISRKSLSPTGTGASASPPNSSHWNPESDTSSSPPHESTSGNQRRIIRRRNNAPSTSSDGVSTSSASPNSSPLSRTIRSRSRTVDEGSFSEPLHRRENSLPPQKLLRSGTSEGSTSHATRSRIHVQLHSRSKSSSHYSNDGDSSSVATESSHLSLSSRRHSNSTTTSGGVLPRVSFFGENDSLHSSTSPTSPDVGLRRSRSLTDVPQHVTRPPGKIEHLALSTESAATKGGGKRSKSIFRR